MKALLSIVALFFFIPFYGQKDTLAIVRHTTKDLITPKNSKVVYRAIPNELFVDVPNSKSFEVLGIGISKISKNIYSINPAGGTQTSIVVAIVLKNNQKVKEQHVFEIKNIATPMATFNKIWGSDVIKLQKNSLKDGMIGAIIPDKNIEDFMEVTQFTLKIPGMGVIAINGNKIDNNVYEKLMRNVSKGDLITIFDIKTRTTKSIHGPFCTVIAPLVIQIL